MIAIKASNSLCSAGTRLVHPKSTCSFHQYSFLTYYSFVWNKLPVASWSATNIHLFRCLLSSHLSLENIRKFLNPHIIRDQNVEQEPSRIWPAVSQMIIFARYSKPIEVDVPFPYVYIQNDTNIFRSLSPAL